MKLPSVLSKRDQRKPTPMPPFRCGFCVGGLNIPMSGYPQRWGDITKPLSLLMKLRYNWDISEMEKPDNSHCLVLSTTCHPLGRKVMQNHGKPK